MFRLTLRKKPFLKGRAWIELDRKALKNNAEALMELLPPGCLLMPALKADAYGHGAVLIGRELNSLGIKAFCVASLEEGIVLRRNKVKGEILILGYTHPEQFYLLRKYHLMQTVIDYSYALLLNHYGKKICVHVALDTGMHRLGEPSGQLDNLYKIFEMEHLDIKGLYTHLSAADLDTARSRAFTHAQITSFYDTAASLKSKGFPCPKLHLAASYGLLRYPEASGDYARAGIALYGILSTKMDIPFLTPDLHPVLSVKARVAAVKPLHPGDNAGYGLQYTATEEKMIAAITIGYGDGLPRSLSNGKGHVLIHGRPAPILGLICMDQTILDITCIPDVKPGDTAVILGSSGSLSITAADMAEQAGTISNEILSRLGQRLERMVL